MGGKPLRVTRLVELKKPAVFLRNIAHITEEQLAVLLKEFKVERQQLLRASKDVCADMAVLYFPSEAEALRCAAALKGLSFAGKKIGVAYRF